MGVKNFKKFVRDYRIIALTVALIIGLASAALIQSLVNDVILPILRPLISSNSVIWEDITLSIGGANIRLGSFLSSFLNLVFIILFLYILVAKILKWRPK